MIRSQLLQRSMSIPSKIPDLSRFPIRSSLLPLAVAVLLAACGQQAPQQHGFPPAPVSVMTVAPADAPVEFEYVAQTAGSREVEIRARVTGILMKRNYTEGGMVKAGQSLFTLDLAPYQIAAAKAEADLASAEASLAQSQRQATRLKPLIEANAVSQKDYDDATSGAQVATANVKVARAQLNQARLNLTYARVDSPITGVASRALKSEGALVSGPDVLLTTVSQVNPIYVNFGIPDSDQLKLRRDIEAGLVKLPADGSLHPRKGRLQFSDTRVSTNTGTVEAEAELPNPDGALKPGQFVRVRLTGATRVGAVRVAQRAVLEGPAGKFVYLVGAGDKAEMRLVEVGEWSGDSWLVRSGLKPGDRVITDGVMKIGPGAPVSVGPPPGAPGAAGADGKGAPDGAKGGTPKDAAKDPGKADAGKPDAGKELAPSAKQ